jgi:hypothetical protein
MQVVVERCAFLDVHRDTVMACARTPDGAGGRREEVAQFGISDEASQVKRRSRREHDYPAMGRTALALRFLLADARQ